MTRLNIFTFKGNPYEDSGPALPSLGLNSNCGPGCPIVASAFLFDEQ